MPEGNILFLVCSPCCEANEADFGIKLCQREGAGWYEHTTPTKQFDAWLAKHRKCGGRNPDHFQLAHMFSQNHDVIPVKPTFDAVHQVLDS